MVPGFALASATNSMTFLAWTDGCTASTIGTAATSATGANAFAGFTSGKCSYNGARWFSDGRAVSFSSDRFEPVGEYHGFPVYRDAISGSADIWVAVVKDGPLAPYRKQ